MTCKLFPEAQTSRVSLSRQQTTVEYDRAMNRGTCAPNHSWSKEEGEYIDFRDDDVVLCGSGDVNTI
jgi:hypothetical protein